MTFTNKAFLFVAVAMAFASSGHFSAPNPHVQSVEFASHDPGVKAGFELKQLNHSKKSDSEKKSEIKH